MYNRIASLPNTATEIIILSVVEIFNYSPLLKEFAIVNPSLYPNYCHQSLDRLLLAIVAVS